jgi:hypothetical protein
LVARFGRHCLAGGGGGGGGRGGGDGDTDGEALGLAMGSVWQKLRRAKPRAEGGPPTLASAETAASASVLGRALGDLCENLDLGVSSGKLDDGKRGASARSGYDYLLVDVTHDEEFGDGQRAKQPHERSRSTGGGGGGGLRATNAFPPLWYGSEVKRAAEKLTEWRTSGLLRPGGLVLIALPYRERAPSENSGRPRRQQQRLLLDLLDVELVRDAWQLRELDVVTGADKVGGELVVVCALALSGPR